MKRYAIALAVLLVGCARHHSGPPKPPANDWAPPVFHVMLGYDGVPASVCPGQGEVDAVYAKVAQCWLDYYKSKGLPRPATMPGPGQIVNPIVTFVSSCSNSAEMPAHGTWGVDVKATHCTTHEYEPKEFMLGAIGHRLCHVFVPGSGGNAMHGFYKATCGY